ncbi:MAG TPA: hypothetical protein VI248_08775 [Kineosporiaceae bacterium]
MGTLQFAMFTLSATDNMYRPKTVLDQIKDLKDVLITADALHCQTARITYLLGRGAHLLVCAKGNQPGPLKRLKDGLF